MIKLSHLCHDRPTYMQCFIRYEMIVLCQVECQKLFLKNVIDLFGVSSMTAAQRIMRSVRCNFHGFIQKFKLLFELHEDL